MPPIVRSQGIPRSALYGGDMVERITRSGLLVRIGGLLAGAAGMGFLRAGSAPAASAVSCVLTPELTEGPYYISGEKLRRNITEGRPGTRRDVHNAQDSIYQSGGSRSVLALKRKGAGYVGSLTMGVRR